MFDESPNSKAIWEYFNRKYGQMIAPVGLAKVCSVLSPKINERYTCSIFVSAPTRQFKSITTLDAATIFPKKWSIKLGSDFTIHDIYEHFGPDLGKVCLMVNDATLLLTSKGKKTKDRLINALAELISDREYSYGDRMSRVALTGKVSLLMNMTLESYQYYKDMLLGSSFMERVITLFYAMPMREQMDFVMHKHKRVCFKWKDFKPENFKTKKKVKFGHFLSILSEKSHEFAVLAGKSFFGTDDQLKSLVAAHACLNGREEVCRDDIEFLYSLKSYFNNPFAPNEHKIIQFKKEGRSQKDICLLLNKDPDKYQPYVSLVIRKAKLRGLIEI